MHSPYLKPLFWLFFICALLAFALIIIISPALGAILLLLALLALVLVMVLKPGLWDAVRPRGSGKKKKDNNASGNERSHQMMLESCTDPRVRIILDRADFVIGRSSGCHYVIDAPTVSRRHCMICERSRSYTITDLGSNAGTYVNDGRLEPHVAATLRINNTVTIDGRRFIFKQVR